MEFIKVRKGNYKGHGGVGWKPEKERQRESYFFN
jgi:hypothetical protein